MKRILILAIFLASILGASRAEAQLCLPNSTPNFYATGNVFGYTSPQWNQFFGAKVDINNGQACNLTVQSLTVIGSALFPGGPLGTMAYQNASSIHVTGATLLTGLPAPVNATDAATKAYVDSKFGSGVTGPNTSTIGDAVKWTNAIGTTIGDAGAPGALTVQDDTALAATPATASLYPNGVIRSTFYPPGTLEPNTPLAPPETFVAEIGTCSTNNYNNDGISCRNATGGNSWVGLLTNDLDPREAGAYCDVVGKPEGGYTYDITVVNGASVIDVQHQIIGAPMIGAWIVIGDIISGGPNLPTFYGQISGVASDGAGGTNVTVSATTWTNPSLTNQPEPVWYGHDDAVAINVVNAYIGDYGYSGVPRISASTAGCGVESEPVIVSSPVDWAMNLYALGAANLPIPTTAVLEINGPGGGEYVGSYSNNFGVECSLLPVNCVWMSTNGFTHWTHGRIYDWQGTTPSPVATFSSASSVNQGVFTGAITGCSGSAPYTCTLTVTAVASGSIQLGNSLSDGGVTIPSGTYVSAQAFPTMGGVGTYTVVNATSSPAVGSETIDAVGLDLAVSGASVNDIGLVSRGNGTYIGDRTMVVGYNSTTGDLILNTAPVTSFSGQTINLYRDANGVVISGAGSFVGSNSAGWHLDQSNIRVAANDAGDAGDRYGCAIYQNGHGQSIFANDIETDGIAPVCIGPNANGSYFELNSILTDSLDSGALMNPPGMVVMDGAVQTFLDYSLVNSHIQMFDASLASPSVTINQPKINSPAAGMTFAPNDTYYYYTEYSNGASPPYTSLNNVIVSSFATNPSATPGGIAYVTGGASWQWIEETPLEASRLANSTNPIQCNHGAHPCWFPQGIDLNMSPLFAAGRNPVAITSAYTFSPSDTFGDFRLAGAGGYALTIPESLNSQVIAGTSPATWEARIVQTVGSADTIAFGGDVTLYEGGSSVASPVTLSMNVPYILWCPRNGDSVAGTEPICYLYKEEN